MATSSNGTPRRPLRVGAVSGAIGDKIDGMERMAKAGNVDVLFGDYLAEINLANRALEIIDDPTKGYEPIFLYQFKRSIDDIVKNKLKLICNAGGLNVKELAKLTQEIIDKTGHKDALKLAYVTGDNLLPKFEELKQMEGEFQHLEGGGASVAAWPQKAVAVNAYIGATGIVEALNGGADIILTGRVTDASPVIGAAIWWHGWSLDNYDAIAGTLLCGHSIECGSYVTGGNFCAFLEIIDRHYDFAFPIAEIAHDGTYVVTKHPNTTGLVSVDTVRCQILYEIQGNMYLNPDVQADLTGMKVESDGPDRVRVSGVKGLAPPSSTKVAIFAVAGFQAEMVVLATGLHVAEKLKQFQVQAEKNLGEEAVKKFTTWSFVQYGVPEKDPHNQAAASCCMRVFAQAPTREAFGPSQFLASVLVQEGLGTFPGAHFFMDYRTWIPKPYVEFYPARFSVNQINVETVFVDSGKVVAIPKREKTIPYIKSEDYDYTGNYDPTSNGRTTRAPLGSIVLARSGDKGGNANAGFFVRNEDEYEWLRATLTKKLFTEFLVNEKYTRIERVEFPGIQAVHFVVHDILEKGVSSTARADSLGKSFAEYIRAREVEIPNRFLERGWVNSVSPTKA